MMARFVAVVSMAVAAATSAQTPVVTATPACPELTRTRTSMTLPQIRFAYDPSAQAAQLKEPQKLTLHLIPLGYRKTLDLPMLRGADGVWSAAYDSTEPGPPGAFVFYFEDGDHHLDDKSGAYYDLVTCWHGKPSSGGATSVAQTWAGARIGAETERQRDLARAIAMLKTQLEQTPEEYNVLAVLWGDELALGGYSPASYEQFGRELDAAITAHATDYHFFLLLSGVVASYEAKLPPATISHYRQTAWELPEKADPVAYDYDTNTFKPRPRDNYWVANIAHSVHDQMLSEFDLQAIREMPDAKERIDRYLAFEKEYPVSNTTGSAFVLAAQDVATLGDAAAAARLFAAWSDWDPLNPDPWAWMGKFDVDHKVELEHAVVLLNQSMKLFKAQNPGATRLSSNHSIKAQTFKLVGPYANSNGKIELIRGQAYLALNRRKEACDDFSAAAKAMPANKEVSPFLILACQEISDHVTSGRP